MMSSAVAFQMKGFGLVFQWAAQVVMASVSSATLVNVPRACTTCRWGNDVDAAIRSNSAVCSTVAINAAATTMNQYYK